MCFLASVISLQYKQYITTWIFRIDHFMVSYLNILQNIFTFVTINSTFSCSQALLFESLQDCLPHKFLLVILISYALTTFVSSLSSSTVVTSRNSVPSIIIVATTACSTPPSCWPGARSRSSRWTFYFLNIFIVAGKNIFRYFFYNITSSGICNLP